MKKLITLASAVLFFMSCSEGGNVSNANTENGGKIAPSQSRTISYTPDLITNLRNPATGWTMYEEGWSFEGKKRPGNIYTPEIFWKQMEDADAPKYANILYIRINWKDLEPEEGKYAWIYNDKYKWYIQKAKEHGLKLAFRIVCHGGVPDYVYQAGAKHGNVDGEGKIQPYYDDPIFLEKFKKFIMAFGKEYDNPDVVDYVDAYGLGRWGEGHGLIFRDRSNYPMVMQAVTEAYAKAFKKVLTVINLSSADYNMMKPLVYDRLGFLPRRDGIGSKWFNDQERGYIRNELFPGKAIIGEGCYWFNASNGDNSHYNAFKNDNRFKMNNFKDAFTVAVTDALNNHCNTFDLRVPLECKFWIQELPDQVQKFITMGGYRLYPDYITVNQDGNGLRIFHTWKNYGVGVLPNNHPNWNHKYRVSFALLDKNDSVKYIYHDSKAEPGNWIKGHSYNYVSMFDIPKNLKGTYTLCVGITDKTKADIPSIDLAVPKDKKIGRWVKVEAVSF